MLVNFIILYTVEISLSIPEKAEENFNKYLKKKDEKLIRKKLEEFNKNMKNKYITFGIISIILNGICLMYSTIFCSIYSGTVNGWIKGSLLGVFLDLSIVSICISTIRTFVRIIIRNVPFFRFLIIIDYSFFILNFFL